MGDFEDKQQAAERALIFVTVLRLDTCLNTYGVAPCTAAGAAGTECYNTHPTCQDRANFVRGTKDIEISTRNAPLPYPGPRPYEVGVKFVPTEITDTLAIKGRVGISAADEPEPTDLGLDPYAKTRPGYPNLPGTFWKKLIARNPNYKGRPVFVKEGYDGLAAIDYKVRWEGEIEDIKITGGSVEIACADPMRRLDKTKVPAEIQNALESNIDAAVLVATLSDNAGMADAGYIRINDELIAYSAINRGTNVATFSERGAFDTTAAAHDEGDKVELAVRLTGNPYDLVKGLLENDPDSETADPNHPGAGIAPARIDADTFTDAKAWPGTEPEFDGIIDEPTRVSDIIREILNTTDASIWYGDGQQFKVKPNVPNQPGRTFVELTDAANLAINKSSAEWKDESRLTRVTLLWERRTGVNDTEKRASYGRREIAVNYDLEGPNAYGEEAGETINCRFLTVSGHVEEVMQAYAEAVARRRLGRKETPAHRITAQVERKDSDLLTGDDILVTSDELQGPDGEGITQIPARVVKRTDLGKQIKIELELFPDQRFAFIAPGGHPAYDDATTAEKDYCYIADADGLIDGKPGYKIY